MRKTLLALGLFTLLAFGAGLGAIGALATTDDDGDEATAMHQAMAGMPMAGMGAMAGMPMGGMPMGGMPMGGMPMGGMAAMDGMEGMAGMPMGADAMADMHAAMPADAESMDAKHAAMSAQMPAELRARCDEAHTRMTTASAAG